MKVKDNYIDLLVVTALYVSAEIKAAGMPA